MNYGSLRAGGPPPCAQQWKQWENYHGKEYRAGQPIRRPGEQGNPGRLTAEGFTLTGAEWQYKHAVDALTRLQRDCPGGPRWGQHLGPQALPQTPPPVKMTFAPAQEYQRQMGGRRDFFQDIPWWGWLLGGAILVRAMR